MALSPSASQEEKNAHYRAALRAYAAAVSGENPQAANALFADDGGIDDPVGVVKAEGRAEVRGFFENLVGRGVRLEVSGPICTSKSDAAAMPVRAVIAASGAELNCICVAHFDPQGLIRRYRVHWGPGDQKSPEVEAPPRPGNTALPTLKPGASQEEKNERYRAVLRAYTAAVSSDDVEAANALFADNGGFEDPVGVVKAEGRAQIRDLFQKLAGRGVRLDISGPICTSRANAAAVPVRAVIAAAGMQVNCICVAQFDDQGFIERFLVHWGPGD